MASQLTQLLWVPHPPHLQGCRHSVTLYTAEDRNLYVGTIRFSTKAGDTFKALFPCCLAVQLVSEQLLIRHVTLLCHSLGHKGVPSYFLHISRTLHKYTENADVFCTGCELRMIKSEVNGSAQPQKWSLWLSSCRVAWKAGLRQPNLELQGRAHLAVHSFAVSSVEEPCILPRSTCCMTQTPTCIDRLHTVNHHGVLISCLRTKQDEQNV